jgi:uncharacterized membrane protein YkvA (DUF1232 family)
MKQSSMLDNTLPQKISAYFQTLCEEYPPETIDQLQDEIQTHVRNLELALSANEFLDIDTARQIADVLRILIKGYDRCTSQHRIWITGAARYFIHDLDVEPDMLSVLGLDDDVTVLNHVLLKIGRPELSIEYK